MIKVIHASYLGDYQVALVFSDSTEAVYDGKSLLSRDGALVDALRDEDYFKRLFVEAGAVCWPNGLELAPARLYEVSRVTEPD